MPRLLLVDGSNYLHRAYHALPPLTTSRGEPTGALKGFDAMLSNVGAVVSPDYRACVFDHSGKNFRHEIYPDYKANRPPLPDDLRAQIEPIRQLVTLLGWPLVSVAGVEADDVLASLAETATGRGWDVFIATGDKDLAQVVSDRVCLINTMSREVLRREQVISKYGVPPESIVDYLALVGDKVDNVPGVEKCGPVTAVKWLREWGTLDNLVAHAGEIGGKIGERLREGLPTLSLSRRLVTVDRQVDTGVSLDDLALRQPEPGLADFYARWEMSSARRASPAVKAREWAGQGDLFGAAAPADVQVTAPTAGDGGDCRLVTDRGAVSELSRRLAARPADAPPVALEVLADRAAPMLDRPVGLALALSPLERYYLPLGHDEGGNLPTAELSAGLAGWLSSEAPKVCHDVKYARHALANGGLELGGPVDDTMLMSYVLEAHLRHDLSRVAARHLSLSLPDWDDLLGKGAHRVAASSLAPARAAEHLCGRAAAIRAASAVMATALAADRSLDTVYRGIELPVSRVLFDMERVGVAVDAAVLERLSAELGAELDRMAAEIEREAGEKFNIASPKQLAEVLFDRLGLPVIKKTASGSPSTDEEVLSELSRRHRLPRLILDYRAISKLKGTYTDKLPLLVSPRDGRIHTTFAQATAVTGRLASLDPNLQNIPARTPEGRRIRGAFVAPAGRLVVSVDYSQIELRVMAHVSGDTGMIRAFREGGDIHRATAAEVFQVAPDQVTPEQRRMAKVINFGLIYGMSSFGLAQNLGISRADASAYIGQYFSRYPGVADYMSQTRDRVARLGYAETVFGRRLWVPDISDRNPQVRAAAERAAINAPIQGTAADLIKMAMKAVADWLRERSLGSRLVLQVHDELVLESPLEEVDLARAEVPRLMAGVAELAVPLIAEVGVGRDWEAAH